MLAITRTATTTPNVFQYFLYFLSNSINGVFDWLILVYTTGEMIPFQERKKIRKILYSKLSLLALLALFLVVANGAWNIYQKATIARAERDRAERSLADLAARTTELQASLARLESERGIEEDVRQKFTVARPGEDVVVIVDDGTKKSENSEAGQQGFWARIAAFLGF